MLRKRPTHRALQFPCLSPGCMRWFRNISGRTQHMHACHTIAPAQDLPQPQQLPSPSQSPPPDFLPPPPDFSPPRSSPGPMADDEDPESEFTDASERYYSDGVFLPPGTPPTPVPPKSPHDWSPYRNDIEFATAEFSHRLIARLNGRAAVKHNDHPPFADHKDLHKVIDATQLGNVAWQCLSVQYTGEHPEHDAPPWMDREYEVWYRDPRIMVHNMLANPIYKGEIDYAPFREDFMSADWAWQQAIRDKISKDPNTHGSTFVLIILGSDKTTVSVGTGNNEYYPLYASISNVHNNVRCTHCDTLVIISFLAIPKTDRQHAHDDLFHVFRQQLFHRSLSAILSTLKPVMTKYEVLRCADGHFQRVIFGLGPYIADYEEQLVLSCTVKNWCLKCLANQKDLDGGGLLRCREHTDILIHENIHPDTLWDEYGIISVLIPFTNDFPRADIHQLISFDLLHQLVKGAFKDHLVDWVVKYLRLEHGTKQGDEIMSDIDRRIAVVAPFTGLQRFPDSRSFKQWTGNDSKALMKVFIPAIEGHVPQDMVRAFRAEACLDQLKDALARFHHYHQIFETTGTVSHFSLPRQHSMTHYADMIRLFGAPNGLCSSITESKHIKAVKQPWRWSSKHNAIGQILLANQRLDKLAASRVDFAAHGMLVGSVLSRAVAALQRTRAQTVATLAEEVGVKYLRCLIRHFLFLQLFPNDPRNPEDVPAASCSRYNGRLEVFNSAAATFYAPSDPSGIGGMRREQIRACPLWRNVYARNDCMFVNTNSNLEGMKGLEVARVKCFFSFRFNWAATYPCALVHWFDKVSDSADKDTDMWIVRPSVCEDGTPNLAVIHIDTVYRAAHLIPVYGPDFIPKDIKYFYSYDAFRLFYVNKYADHYVFEIVS
ncbi:uncharacterized protein F5147DRAFT_743077 [Suillus discolor]|uniref:C2H2-type domain-containing protein n=1 Tax=Suillus discolor TaxID=1912936 RepID=A0A9P7JZ17_9AGAM|nr:uncharacterized protein F5147DRAFT_743077 [Suillus discolor]KAG2116424.1 hypothetical protein F5147DRAFT_743077 [Suillus discolor]